MNLDYPSDLIASVALIVAGLHYDSLTAKLIGYALLAFTVLTPNIRSLVAIVRSRQTDRR